MIAEQYYLLRDFLYIGKELAVFHQLPTMSAYLRAVAICAWSRLRYRHGT